MFHKVGRTDGSAKCDVHFTGVEEHFVFGVLYRIDPMEKLDLDREEGLDDGYEEQKVEVLIDGGGRVEAFTYHATRVDPSLRPYSWYKNHVVTGARENGLPPEYVSSIESVASISDPDSERERQELGIYR